MTSRCASCHYPLTVIDSVSCYECSSHFHLDCGQSFGFPFFVLSADPNRNKFRCTTCQILPLPFSRFQSDSDLCEMPSRQLDYQQDDQSDLVNGMNELKGNVQDLHELCKDMLREINEIKSINLTLRCCIENLRHDNEERDGIIVDLKRRIELLEKRDNIGSERNKLSQMRTEELYVDREETYESYAKTKYEHTESVRPKNVRFDPDLPANDDDIFQQDISETTSWSNEEKYPEKANKSDREETIQPEEESVERTTEEEDINKNIFTKNTVQKVDNYSDYRNEEKESQDVLQFDKNIHSEVINEIHSTHDWEWKGNKAVEMKDAERESDDEDEENEDLEPEILSNSLQTCNVSSEEGLNPGTELYVGKYTEDVILGTNVNDDEEDLGIQDNAAWEDENVSEDEDEESETLVTQREVFKTDVHSHSTVKKESEDKQEENVQQIHEETEDEDDKLQSEDADDEGSTTMEVESRLEINHPERDLELGDVGHKGRLGATEDDNLPEGVEVLDESRVEDRAEHADHSLYAGEDGETRLDVEVPVEGLLRADGEDSLGEQSPEQGEVQPSELQIPKESQHTEDDLWDYLRQTVKSVHPSTTQEFIENFIGTLKHVPEDLLKPVVTANIKRANTPSDSEGGHLKSPSPELREHPEGETNPAGGSSVLTEKGSFGETEIPHEEMSSEMSEEPSTGYTVMEGALFGAFWACSFILGKYLINPN